MTKFTLARLRDLLQEVSPAVDWSQLGIEDNLTEAGLDSLDKAALMMRLEDEIKQTISDEVYDRIETAKQIIEYISDPNTAGS